KDQPQRRSWRGHGPQSLVLRLVRQQLLHLQLGQRVAPRPDEVVAIEIEKIVGEIVVLLAERRLLAGFAQDPAIAPHSLRQVTKLGNEFVLESIVGEERGNADRIERLASVGLEYTGGVEAGFARDDPVAGSRRPRLRFQQFVGALRDAQPRKGLLTFLDEAAVKLNQRRLLGFQRKHRIQMVFE